MPRDSRFFAARRVTISRPHCVTPVIEKELLRMRKGAFYAIVLPSFSDSRSSLDGGRAMGMPQPREFAGNEVRAEQAPHVAAAPAGPSPVPAGPTNLPLAVSSFVGREAQIREVA